ncbi:MAG TPA: hypothetical protein VH120_07085 [Gemmataceae bacterium]|nr:hypothetical protein [Gemmataceae bacterium]
MYLRQAFPLDAIDQSNVSDDLDPAELSTEVSRGIDKWLWFVEAACTPNADPCRLTGHDRDATVHPACHRPYRRTYI